jgi:hypothetical protein
MQTAQIKLTTLVSECCAQDQNTAKHTARNVNFRILALHGCVVLKQILNKQSVGMLRRLVCYQLPFKKS